MLLRILLDEIFKRLEGAEVIELNIVFTYKLPNKHSAINRAKNDTMDYILIANSW